MNSVVVRGGGPAGIAAAIAARRRGFAVTVADARVPPIDKACGEGLMPDGLDAARELGVDLSLGEPMRGVRFIGESRSVEAPFPARPAYGFRRTGLHAALVRQAEREGVTLRWNTSVRDAPLDTGSIDAWWIDATGPGTPAAPQRFGFRQHFRARRWTDYLEIHWAAGLQIYITPIAPDEIGIAVLTRDPKQRVAEALQHFPEVRARLIGPTSSERGCATGFRTLAPLAGPTAARVGDASGTVDAITGQGLALSFRQSFALASAMAAGDLAPYQAEHHRMFRRPRAMARILLALDRSPALRTTAFAIMERQPWVYRAMLAFHVNS